MVDDFGIAPYWLGSMIFRIAGAMSLETIHSSPTLEMQDVKEIGHKCLFISIIGFYFGSGVTSAYFHDDDNLCSLYELLKTEKTGFLRIQFKIQLEIPSGPLISIGSIGYICL